MTTILENTYVSQAWFSYVNVPLFTWHIDILQLVKHLLSWNEWLMGSFGCVKSVYRFCGIASLNAVVFWMSLFLYKFMEQRDGKTLGSQK